MYCLFPEDIIGEIFMNQYLQNLQKYKCIDSTDIYKANVKFTINQNFILPKNVTVVSFSRKTQWILMGHRKIIYCSKEN